MKILLDENVDNRLKDFIQNELDFEVSTTFDEDLTGSKDESIADYCLENDLVILTHDDDFLSLTSDSSLHASIIYMPQRLNFREMKKRLKKISKSIIENQNEIYFL